MARDFPFCEVVGVDLVPIRESAPFAAVLTLKGMCSYTVSFSASTLPPNARWVLYLASGLVPEAKWLIGTKLTTLISG